MSYKADTMLLGAFMNVFKHMINFLRNPKEGDIPSLILAILNFLLILILVGAEGMKVIFRNNFGRHGIDPIKLILSICCIAGIAYVFDDASLGWRYPEYGVAAIIYYAIAIFILVKGIISYVAAFKNKPDSDYNGDSYLTSLLDDYGYDQEKIQNVVEPVYIILIGSILYFYSPLTGYPLIFCGLSIWLNLFFVHAFGNPSNESSKSGTPINQKQETITNQVLNE